MPFHIYRDLRGMYLNDVVDVVVVQLMFTKSYNPILKCTRHQRERGREGERGREREREIHVRGEIKVCPRVVNHADILGMLQ